MKVCTICTAEKDVLDFYSDSPRDSSYHAICALCRKDGHQEVEDAEE